MEPESFEVQRLDARDVAVAALAIGAGALYLALWFAAPSFLQMRLGTDGTIFMSVILAVLIMLISVVLAWASIRSGETSVAEAEGEARR